MRQGSLIEALSLVVAEGQLSSADARAAHGIPAAGPAATGCGTLLLDLLARAEPEHLDMRLEFRPWKAAHLRYRLDFGGARWYDGRRVLGPYIHGRSVEEVLLAGLAYLASPDSHRS
jgi:hypothetical protein